MVMNSIEKNKLRSSNRFAEEIAFWSEYLGDRTEVTRFPFDLWERESDEPIRVSKQFTLLDSDKVISFTNDSPMGCYLLLITAVAMILKRNSGDDPVVMGIPVVAAERSSEEQLSTFVPLIVSVEKSENSAFISLLSEVGSNLQSIDRHKNILTDHFVNHFGLRDSAGYNELFGVGVLMEGLQDKKSAEDAALDLLISLRKENGLVKIELQFNPARYHDSTMEQVGSRLVNIINAAISDPTKRLIDLGSRDNTDKRKILNEFNRTPGPLQTTSIKDLFEEQCERLPHKTALVHGSDVMTYRELNRRANRVAWELKERGVTRETVVGVAMDQGFDRIASLLGILKAGGAFLPLNGGDPPDRLAHMLEESGAACLLVDTLKDGPFLFRGETLTYGEASRGGREDNPPEASSPDQLAYIMYTSGSTGTPKGVMVEHRGVVRLVKDPDYLVWQETDRILQGSTIAFDASTFEIWGALLNGLELHLVEKVDLLDGERLSQKLIEDRITIMWVTAPLFHQLQRSRPAMFKTLRYVLVGGDALSPGAMERARETCPDTLFLNGYGPTENTTFSTVHVIDQNYRKNIPIGKPIRGSTAYILDHERRLQPIGAVGEIYVGGAGVARGYIGQEALTRERFIPDPFAGTGRLYQTGDLGRWLEDGSIEFLGRKDQQVKIRGFRVEPGEVEATLLEHAAVKDGIVLVEERQGEKELLAYVSLHMTTKTGMKDIGDFLKNRLPAYMVPSRLFEVEEIPLTPNGKVDRHALMNSVIDPKRQLEPPRNEMESRILAIWSGLFETKEIGVNERFFELGGNSLTAIKLINRIKGDIHANCTLSDILSNVTVRELSEIILQSDGCGMRAPEVPIHVTAELTSYEASSLQKRLYMSERKAPGTSYNIPLFIKARGRIKRDSLSKAVNQLVQRHEVLRTTYSLEHGALYQWIEERKTIDVSFKKIEASDLEMEMTRFIRPFDLHREVFRVEVLALSEEESLIMIDVHHIASDGHSIKILIKELMELYSGKELPTLLYQYKDFSERQRRYYEQDLHIDTERYWHEQFARIDSGRIDFIPDSDADEKSQAKGGTVIKELDEETASALTALARDRGVTEFVMYLTLLKVLFSNYTQKSGVTIASPVTARDDAAWDGVVGMFANMLPVYSEVVAQYPFTDILQSVHQNMLQAQAHKEYRFEELINELGEGRSQSETPLFNVTFDMHYDSIRATGNPLANVEFELLERDTDSQKFDLSIVAVKSAKVTKVIFQFDSTKFKRDTVQRISEYFINIADQVVKDTKKKISSLLLSPWEAEVDRRELQDFTPSIRSITDLFEEQCERLPDKTALVHGGDVMTYRELNRRANRVAWKLKERGVTRETVVGVAMDQGFNRIASLLGILKAGGAFLPLNGGDPPDRLAHMLEESGAACVLVDTLKDGPSLFRGETLTYSEASRGGREDNPPEASSPDQLAYIMYTSGSTGTPKGVMVEHRGVVRLVKDPDYLVWQETDRILQGSTIAFDASTFEIWGALLNGLELHLVEKDVLLDGERLAQKLIEDRISIMWMTAPLFHQLQRSRPAMFKTLRYVLVGGDALSPGAMERARETCPDTLFLNGYGPTENTTFSTVHVIDRNYRKSIPIGKPIRGSTAYILDHERRLQPIGAVGEIYVGGAGVARGYVGQEALTRERFIPDSFAGTGRLYQTGDLGRWLEDGSIEFLGRKDQQVKIRGFRVEPGEVEATLLEHSAVEDGIVLVEERQGEKELHAYVSLQEKGENGMEEISNFLKKRLPSYMHPSRLIMVEEIPLTPNGKVDRLALAREEDDSKGTMIDHHPMNEVEETLFTIWKNVLGRDNFDTEDHFFEVGGNSLLLMAVYDEVVSTLRCELDIADLFANPSIGLLAEFIEETKTI